MRKTPALVGVALVVLGVCGCNSGAAEYQLGPAARTATAKTGAGRDNLLEAEAREEIAGEPTSTAPPSTDSFLGRPVSSWVDQLESPWDASQRMAAVSILMEIGPGAEGVTSALIDALGDRHPAVREASANTLRRFGPQISGDLSQALYGHGTHSVRAGTAQIMAPLAASDPEVLNALIRATNDRSSLVRRVSAEAIGQAGATAGSAVTALTEALLDDDPDVRASAATALGRIGPAAKAAVPALTVASLDAVTRVATAAREALVKVELRD
jgi:HEAT repeat protein